MRALQGRVLWLGRVGRLMCVCENADAAPSAYNLFVKAFYAKVEMRVYACVYACVYELTCTCAKTHKRRAMWLAW